MKLQLLARVAALIVASSVPLTAQVVPQVIGLGGGCGEPKPLINTSSPLLTIDLTVFVTGVTPGCPTAILISPPLAPYALAAGCTGWVDLGTPLFFNGVADARGSFAVTFPTISLAGFAPGVPCNIQAFCAVPTGTPGAVPIPGLNIAAFVSDGLTIIMGDIPLDPPTDVPVGACCTYSKGGFQGNGVPGQLFLNNYVAAFPAGLTVGVYNPGNGNAPANGKTFTANNTGRTKVRDYLKGGGPSGSFTTDTVNNSDSSGGGNLGRQSAALSINIRLNDLGTIPNSCPVGSLVYVNPGDSLNGATVRQILAAANTALSGGGFPAGHTASSMNELIDNLNLSFHECVTSAWAGFHLFQANA